MNSSPSSDRRGRRHVPPTWPEDDAIRARVFAVYTDHLDGADVATLAVKYATTVSTIYRDIQRARGVAVQQFISDLGQLLAERIEARRHVKKKAYAAIQHLESSKARWDRKVLGIAALLGVALDAERQVDRLLGGSHGLFDVSAAPPLERVEVPVNNADDSSCEP